MAMSQLRQLDEDLPEPVPTEDHPHRAAPQLRALEVVLVAAACWVAALAFRPVFSGVRTLALPTFVAIALATGAAVLAARRGLPTRWSLVGSGIIAGLFVSYTILVDTLAGGVFPGGDTLSGLRQGIAHGFSAMLADSLPLATHTLALVFVTLVCWFAAAVGTELTLRRAMPALPLVAPLAVFGLAMPVVGPMHPPSHWHVAGFVTLLLLIVLVRAVPDPTATGTVIGPRVDGLAEFHSRSLLSARLRLGVPLIALAAVAAPLVATVITTRTPTDPRDLRDTIVEPRRVDDPLAEYKRIVGQSPARPAFQVTVRGATPTEVARVAIVRLDTYDGVRFTISDRYEAAGPVLVQPDDRPTSGRDVVLRFSNLDLDAPWLPTAGAPTRIDLRGIGFDPDSCDVLAPGNVNGLDYELQARIPVATAADLGTTPVVAGTDSDRYRALPGGLPPNIGRLATEVTAGSLSAGESLEKLAAYLRSGFALDATSPSGHAAGRLDRFLGTERAGTPEQFATAFTVMARSLGYPTRVVVGYKLVTEENGALRPLEFVTSASYHVWAEVAYEGLGWIAYDVTPSPTNLATSRGVDLTPAPETVTPVGGGEQRTPRAIGPSEADPSEATDAPWWRPLAVAAFVVLGLVALVAGVCGGILGAKAARRRRRRTTGDAATRVIGAWDEVVDRLRELRFPITDSMTPRDIARATRSVYGTAATLPLGFLVPDVGRAIYAPTVPDDELAERSWARALEFEQNLAITLNGRQRWRARLSLRPLGLGRHAADD